jgi:GrpB-like predicted nucleotidyltransferase (UPF0157 family)
MARPSSPLQRSFGPSAGASHCLSDAGQVRRQRDQPVLGLTYGRVLLVESNPRWADEFVRLAIPVSKSLGELAVALEHVGSTAVPGLVAKPILDLAIGLASDADAGDVTAKLEALGYQFRGDKGELGGLLFVLEDRPAHRIAHVHVVRFGDRQWRGYLRFRDLLRLDAEAADAYAAFKRQIAAQFPEQRAAYTAAKASFIARLLEQQ